MLNRLYYLLLLLSGSLYAQNAHDLKITVQTWVQIEEDCLRLHWIQEDDVENYFLYKKGITDQSWGAPIAEMDGTQSNFVDCDVVKGVKYEYRIVKKGIDFEGYGYLLSGIEIASNFESGNLLIIIDVPSFNNTSSILGQYINVLKSEGWDVIVDTIRINNSVSEVKDMIVDRYESQNISSILLLGDVPVPHSGNFNIDGHGNHQGAWSADLFYGEIDGIWTDNLINNVTSSNERNHNIPGDGNWDQSSIPSDIEIPVGRIDFDELSIFIEDKYTLLRDYLTRNIEFRTGQMSVNRQALIEERFNRAEAFGHGAIRSFSPIVGQSNVHFVDYDSAFVDTYLWTHGSGGGSYTSASGISTSSKFADNEFKGIFNIIFGSYFGDYDTKSNLMRSLLASGEALCTMWSGRPHWVLHPMGLGATIGECTVMSQNNINTYHTGFGARLVHTNLLGDPTLKSFVITPPQNLVVSEEQFGFLLEWTPGDAKTNFYEVYRREVGDSKYERIGRVESTLNYFRDSCLTVDRIYEYQVRAEKLEITASGSFYHLSGGPSYQITRTIDQSVNIDIELTVQENFAVLVNQSLNSTHIVWTLPDGSTIESDSFALDLNVYGGSQIQVEVSNECNKDSLWIDIPNVSDVEDVKLKEIRLYPNPASQEITLSLPLLEGGFAVFNMLGQDVSSYCYKSKEKLNIENLPLGMYHLVCDFEDRMYKLSFVKVE